MESETILIVSMGMLIHHRQWQMGFIRPNFNIIGCYLGPVVMVSWD